MHQKEIEFKIFLYCWYQEYPEEYTIEHYENKVFSCLDDACKYIGENGDKMLDDFPVVKIEISV